MANEGIITLNDLQTKFRAAGVYTIYRDQSVSPNVTSQPILRLVVGFSKTGPFNIPVYINQGDTATAEKLFGKVDKSLQRKMSWFHKSLQICLQSGPVLALNLLKLNNEVDENGVPTDNADQVAYRSLSTDIAALNGVNTDKLYASYYDKERFWKPSKSYLLATRKVADKGSIFNMVNLSQQPLTFLVRKSTVKGFDVTVQDWYAGSDTGIPAFLKSHDLISDYFIDVVVIAGDWGESKYAQLSVDPVYGKYFDVNGLKTQYTNEFLGRNDVTVKNIYTGALIPNFVDKTGESKYIEDIVNSDTRVTGLLCAIDKAELDKFDDATNTHFIDLVGHRLLSNQISQTDFLSYRKKITQDFAYSRKTTNSSANLTDTNSTITSGVKKFTFTIPASNPQFDDIDANVEVGALFYGVTTSAGTASGITVSNPVLEVTSILKTDTQITMELTSPLKQSETSLSGSFVDLDGSIATPEELATGSITISVAGSTGDTITARVQIGSGPVTVLGSYTVQSGDNSAAVADGLKDAINLQTGTHGYSASHTYGSLVDLTAPTGSGATVNGGVVSVVVSGSVAGSTTNFSGGVTQIKTYTYEAVSNRFFLDGTNTYYIADVDAPIYLDYKSGALTNGDTISDGTDTFYIKFTDINSNADFRSQVQINLFTDEELTVPISTGAAVAFGASYDSNGYQVSTSTLLNFISLIGAINQRFDCTQMSLKVARVDISFETDIKLGQYLVGKDSNNVDVLTRITSIKRVGTNAPTHIDIETALPIKFYVTPSGEPQIERFVPLTSFYDRFNLLSLKGFTMKPSHMPNGTNARMKEILSVMTDTNMADALADPDMIDFRYYVDTFNHGLEAQSKRQITRLIKARQKCLGLLNAPSMQEFKDSTNPRFTETPTPTDPLPVINVQYIADGANLAENPNFLYTLPEEEDGASFVGYFFPNISVRDTDGEPLSIPPSAPVSNNFMQKFKGANPFLPVAGSRRGIISLDGLVGVEYPLTRDQRGLLEQKGINPIYQKRNGDVVIFGNETGYQKYNSVLNNLNTRDTLITIEIDIENILSNYTFEFNDDGLRTEVSSLLRNYLDGLQNSFGAIVSYDVIFDRNNNTTAIVRENAALVDVIVEPADVVKKFINRITLKKDAPPSIGAFTAL